MAEWKLFSDIPEYATPEWYASRERATHLEQPGHRERLVLAADMVKNAVGILDGIHTVVDLGAGDGGLLSLIQHLPIECWGYDLMPSNIEGAREREVDVRLFDVIGNLDRWIWDANLVVMTEFLEHLVYPHEVLRVVAQHSKAVVASSPYLESMDQHYEYHL